MGKWLRLGSKCGILSVTDKNDGNLCETKSSFNGAAQDEAVPPEVHTKLVYNLLRARGMDVRYQKLDAGHIFVPAVSH